MPTRILIVEDEALVCKDIERTLLAAGEEVVGTTPSAEEGVAKAVDLRPDIVLMDIKLKGAMSGIEAAKRIREEANIPVVFLTAFSDDSTLNKARVAQPYGYIVKPFTSEDLKATIKMALYKHAEESKARMEHERLYQLAQGDAPSTIFLKCDGRLVKIKLEDIYYIEALKDYFSIHVRERRYTIHGTMKFIASRLPTNQFMRVHRSFIIRLDKIQAIDHANVILEDDKRVVPIGFGYRRVVSDRLRTI